MHHVSQKHNSSDKHVIKHHVPAIEKRPEQDAYVNDVKAVISWSAPTRPYRKRQKSYFINLLLIMSTLLVILFLFSQYLLMLVVVSLAFVAFALAVTPPTENHYRVSTEGVAIEDHFYLWQELYDFYFRKRGGVDTLHIRTKDLLPGELIMLLGEISRDKMRNAIIPFLPYREVVRNSFTDKAGEWLVKTFPLDESHLN